MSTKDTLEVFYKKVSFGWWGLVGSGIVLLSSLISAITYIGRQGELYSPLNHFVSELGEFGISPLAHVFNSGLIVGGLLLVFYVVGLGFFFENIFGMLATIVGVFSSFCCSAVGIFPMNYVFAHGLAASLFFIAGGITILIFAIAILTQKKKKVPKYFSFMGVVTVTFVVTMALSALVDTSYSFYNRPDVWFQPALEWAAILSVNGWIMWSSIFNLHKHYKLKRLDSI